MSNEIDTTDDVLNIIPPDWKDAELRIGTSLEENHRIQRVSLQQDNEGRRVVILHKEGFKDM